MSQEKVRLGLVKYTGRKIAPFEQVVGKQTRLWANSRPTADGHVRQQRWLPEAEAQAYHKLPEFQVTQWGGEPYSLPATPQRRAPRRPASTAPPPREVAIPLDALLKLAEADPVTEDDLTQELEEALETVTALGETPELARFLLSSTGMLHKRDCTSASENPTAEFWSLEEAAADPRFKKYHSRCIG
jgi:hypothetical protein